MKSRNESLPFLPLILGATLAIALLWFFWPSLAALTSQLYGSEDYSYGLLLPTVAAYITYLRWPQIRTYSSRPSWAGLAVIALGLLLYIFGELVAIFYFSSVSFIVAITGLVLLLGGWRLVRLLGFPLLLLVFMVPLPSLVIKQLTFPLQLISSGLAAGLLKGLGIPVLQQGNVIDLGVRQLQVAEACSGLRYILPLLVLGTIYCYFYQRRPWKAAFLILSLGPLAIIANAFRVAAMGVFPVLTIEGFWHSFSGWLIFVFSFGILALLNWALNRLWPQSQATAAPKISTGASTSPDPGRTSPTPYLLAALILVILGLPVANRLTAAPPVPLLQSFDHFPLSLGPWQGQRQYLDPAMAQVVGADDYLDANFTCPDQGPVSLWIAFFQSQNKKIGGTIHSPIICLSGAGWKIVESRIMEVGQGLPVRYLLIEQGGTRQVVFYWYFQRGRWLASELPNRFLMGYDGLVKRRNDGAMVRLITPAAPGVDSARDRLASFLRLLAPILSHFIPN